MKEPFHRLAESPRRKQAQRIELDPAALDLAEMHHATRETRVARLVNQTAGLDHLHPLKDLCSVRGNHASAKSKGLGGRKVVHQNLPLFGEQQAAVAEVVK